MRWRSADGRGREAIGMLRACVGSRVVTLMVALASLWLWGWPEGRGPPMSSAQEAKSSPQIWTVPEIGALPNNTHGRLVRRGRDLITATYAHIGPEVADRAKRFAGNNLACSNCHLHAGTKKFGIPLFGLLGEFPHYSARSGAEMTIEDRVNACMTRSMNGRPLPAAAPEMQALLAYSKFLSIGVAPGRSYRDWAPATCRSSTGRRIPRVARRATPMPASRVTVPTAPAFAAACPPPISATWCRRSGVTTASTMARGWRG